MLKYWGEWNMPILDWMTSPNSLGGFLYLGPYFNILPVCAVGLMLVQQKLLSPPPTNEEQEMQQKTMQIMMGVMGLMFYKVAAGLCIYFIASSLWGVAERKLLPKKKPVDPAAAVVEVPNPAKGSNKAPMNARDKKKFDRREKAAKAEEPTLANRLKKWWTDLLEKPPARSDSHSVTSSPETILSEYPGSSHEVPSCLVRECAGCDLSRAFRGVDPGDSPKARLRAW